MTVNTEDQRGPVERIPSRDPKNGVQARGHVTMQAQPPSATSMLSVVSATVDPHLDRPGLLPGSNAAPVEPRIFRELCPIRDKPVGNRHELFRKKIAASGSVVFDFLHYPDAFTDEKEAKRQTLMELIDYTNVTRGCFNEEVIADVVSMVAANLFRPLSYRNSLNPFIVDDDEALLEPGWPHLQIIYEFFLRMIVAQDFDARTGKKYVSQQFVINVLDLFRSEDHRERDYLKTVLHRLYGKVMSLRPFIRKSIQTVFFRIIYDGENHSGVSELLEILGSIINGFAVPLKNEHKIFLENSLLPLHSSKYLAGFQQQLTYCMTQYIDKDPRLAEMILRGLLKFWPVTNTPKEVLFINEVEEILDMVQPSEFQAVCEPLFKQLSMCIRSRHFQVAERVLFLWNNENVVKLINQNRQVLFPIIISSLYANTKDHWNATVHGLTFNVTKLMAEIDPALFDRLSEQNTARLEEFHKTEQNRKSQWEKLEAKHSQRTTATR